mgnify:CR=1 FL=1
MPILGVIASSIYKSSFTPTGSYDALAVYTVGSGGASSITFAGIPQSGYQHLQIRGIVNGAGTGALRYKFNDDAGANYTYHFLDGNGSSTLAGGDPNSYMDIFYPVSSTSNIFSGVISDILDYTNTTKYKTVRNLAGTDLNGSGRFGLKSGMWMNTSAINSINIYSAGGNLSEYSQFALYGIRG